MREALARADAIEAQPLAEIEAGRRELDFGASKPELRAELARRRLADFGALMMPGYERPTHVEVLCEHLERLERGEIGKLAIALPPRHSKSTHVARRCRAGGWADARRTG